MKPGEPFHDPIRYKSDVLTFSNRSDKTKTLSVGLTTVLINFYGYTYSAGGDWPGYIPDLPSAAHGGYGADSSIEIGAGEIIIQHHLKNLYGLQGWWRETPGKP